MQRLLIVSALPLLFLSALEACSETSPNIGRYFRGRTLDISIVSVDRALELRYAHIGPDNTIRHYRLTPQAEGSELILVRLKVENHTATSAIVDVDTQAAELRDFFSGKYSPIDVASRVKDAPDRSVVDLQVDIAGPAGQVLPALRKLNGVISAAHTRSQDRDFYILKVRDGENLPEEISQTAASNNWRLVGIQTVGTMFITGPLVLQMDTGVDGWMVFEAPKGTKFRELKWQAGDSLSIEF